MTIVHTRMATKKNQKIQEYNEEEDAAFWEEEFDDPEPEQPKNEQEKHLFLRMRSEYYAKVEVTIFFFFLAIFDVIPRARLKLKIWHHYWPWLEFAFRSIFLITNISAPWNYV